MGSANERYLRYELAAVVARSTDCRMRGSAKRQTKLPLVVAIRSCASPVGGDVERRAMRRWVGRNCDESQLVKRLRGDLADSRRCCAKMFYEVAEDVDINVEAVVRRDLDPTIGSGLVVVKEEEEEVLVERIWVGMEYYAPAIVPSAHALATAMTSVVRTLIVPLVGDCDGRGISEGEGEEGEGMNSFGLDDLEGLQ